MVNDTLSAVKSSMGTYTTVISECANPQLRAALTQIRNDCEASQFELYKLAQSKGFYQPAAMATDAEVNEVRGIFER